MSEKPTILIDPTLPTGIQANISAALGMTLGRLRPDLVGPDLEDADGARLPGLTTVPIPILAATPDHMAEIFAKVFAEFFSETSTETRSGLLCAPFTRAALQSKTYSDYAARATATPTAAHEILGLLVFGPRKAAARLCGNLPLLR